jgi:hypothetical protein
MHPSERLRLQPRVSSSTSDWFRFDQDPFHDDIFEETARDVLPFLDKAEQWWQG